MRVILFGGTGMVGGSVLRECLDDPRVAEVLSVGRASTGLAHASLREVVRKDLADFSDAPDLFRGFDACFYCLGVSAVGLDEAAYTRITYDLTMAAATAFAAENPGKTFIYVSGEGTDSTEKGRAMWARVKGRTENALLAMPLDAWMFRAGLIVPRKDVPSKTRWYRVFYTLAGPFMPLLRLFFGRHITTASNVGRAMIAIAAGHRPGTRILENNDINRVARG